MRCHDRERQRAALRRAQRGATLIQAATRCRLARDQFERAKTATTRVQTSFRRRMALTLFRIEKGAAIIVQSARRLQQGSKKEML